MLAVPADRLPAAIGDLDPGNRALLDLSLRRGVSDAEIGELLRKEPDDVARGREAVLELLADALDIGGHDRRERVRQAVTALPDEAWSPAAPPPPPPRETVVLRQPRPAPPVDREPDEPDEERASTARKPGDDFYFTPEDERRPRRLGLLWVLGLMAVLGVVAAIVLSSGDDDSTDDGNRSQPTPSQDGPGGEPGGGTAQLAPLGGGPGEGRLSITDEGATITVSDLPKPSGSYQVWLYNSVVQAQSLGSIQGGSGRLEVRLPPDARRYQFLDVSHEPADGNQNHSGESVLRAPLRELLSD
jgi:hypothetical protein